VRNHHYWLRNNPEERRYQLIVCALNFLIDRIWYITALASFQIYTPGGADLMLFSLIQFAVREVCSEV